MLPGLAVHSLLTHGCMHSARPLALPFWPQVQRPSDVSGRLFLVYTSDNANGKSRFWQHISQVRLVFAEIHAKGAERRSVCRLIDTGGSPDEFIHLAPFIARGDKTDSQKVLISMNITTTETKEVTPEKYVISVETGDSCFQIS